MYPGQFQAPQGPGITLASGGFVEEPFGFAVVICAVHSALIGRHANRPRQRCSP
jgi:hypothetical protein